MIFRLEYCNKASVTARVDIQKGGATPIYTVEGTAEPFVLFYNNDKGDKSGSFRSSGADINIYETAEFNIDELKTSNETEISVKYYINNILNWSGFVIPDFFSETITGGKGVVSMVASDRLGTLKGATLSGLSAKVSNRALAAACLAQTGLSLPLYTMANFTGDGTNIFNSEVLSQRMVDTKGRNVSCYDILSSILEETNSLIVQRNGAWYIVNKLQLEAGSGSLYSSPVTSSAWVENTVSFDEVSVGARRTIKPVAATVGVYHEHGGGRLHPDNYDFSGGSTGWVSPNGFPFTISANQIKQYEKVGSTWNVEFGDSDRNRMQINKQWDGLPANLDIIQYVSNSFPVVTTSDDSVTVGIDISVTGNPLSIARFTVLAEGDGKRFAFNPSSGAFEAYDDAESKFIISISPSGPYLGDNKYDAANEAIAYSSKLNVENISDYNISIRVYGTNIPIISGGGWAPMFVDFASVKFSNTAEAPKGNIFKTTQGANYTKDHDIPTVLWGDYLTYGLNGYFYSYPIDDTSSLYRPTGELHSGWTAYGDADTLPLLQHITRQKARMFSVAHDLLSADIKASTFDPLSIFVDCDNTRYVVVSARFDFLRSNVSVELEEVAYATNSKRDYIYSYFGDGEEGIRSIGGISGGTGGSVSGGGLTSEQLLTLNNLASWWKLDEANDAIYSEKNVYSQQGVSAYGMGSGGSGGGGDISKLPSWAEYTPAMVDYYVSAGLLVPFRNDTLSRLTSLEAGGSGGSNVTWGTESGGYVPLTVEGLSKSVALSTHTHSQYALTTHNHSGVYEPVFSKNTAFNKDFGTTSTTVARGNHTHSGVYEPAFTKNTAFNKAFGTTSGTVAQGNDSRINNGQTAYGWGNHASAGYALSTHNHSGVYEPVFSKNTAFNKDFGTTSGTVAQGNDSRIVNGQTAYGWGNHSSAGYATSSALSNYVTLATAQNITGAKTFSSNVGIGTTSPEAALHIKGSKTQSGAGFFQLVLEDSGSNYPGLLLKGTSGYHAAIRSIGGDGIAFLVGDNTTLASVMSIRENGNVGIGTGTTSPSQKLHVVGNILATGTVTATTITASTSVTTPKVIFTSAGWSMEQSVEGVLELKYNGVIKQKFLNDGSIAATGELTAYVAGASGYSEFLPLSGGTLTGNLNIGAGVIIGTAAVPLSVRGNAFKYNNSDVLYKGNIGTASLPSIGLSDGWIIEVQTTPSSALLIKKNGVIKGTFNA